MIRTGFRVVALALALVASAWTNSQAAGLPEATGFVQRYDSASKVVVIGGREYRLVGQAAEAVEQYVAEHGLLSLYRKEIAYAVASDEQGRPVIDVLVY